MEKEISRGMSPQVRNEVETIALALKRVESSLYTLLNAIEYGKDDPEEYAGALEMTVLYLSNHADTLNQIVQNSASERRLSA